MWVLELKLVEITMKRSIADTGIRRQQAQWEFWIVNTAEQLVESPVHVCGGAHGIFECLDESFKVLRDGGKPGCVLITSCLEELGGPREICGGIGDEEATFAHHSCDGKAAFGDEMLEMRRILHEAREPGLVRCAVLRGDEVWIQLGEATILGSRDDAARAHEIVVKELAVWETPAGFAEEGFDFRIVQNAPARQAELEPTRAHVVRPLNALDQRRQRLADESHHALNTLATCFIEKQPSDFIKLPLRDRIAFARRAEDVEIPNATGDLMPHAAAEDVCLELKVFSPRNTTGSENAWAVAFGGHGGSGLNEACRSSLCAVSFFRIKCSESL